MSEREDIPLTGASAPQAGVAASTGAALRTAREQRGWSREDVSVRLKFGVRQIAALEDERWSDLPHGMSLRGFVRNYARVLEIPAEPLLQALGSHVETGDPVSLNQASSLSSPIAPSSGRAWPGSSRANRSGRKRPAPWIIGAIMLVAAIAIVGYALVEQGKLPGIFDASRPAAEAVAITPPAALTADQVATPNTTPVGPTDTAPGAAATQQAVPGGTPAPAASAASPAAPGVAPAAAEPAVPAATSGLVLRTREASWVEVRRADGTVAISQILPANSDFTLEASAAPLRVVIGNVKGVDATWRNAPVDLASARRDNVARLTLN